MKPINPVSQALLIFQRFYLLSFIIKSSQNFNFITESNKALKSGLQTGSTRKNFKNMPTFEMLSKEQACHFARASSSFHPPERLHQLSRGHVSAWPSSNRRPGELLDSAGRARKTNPPERCSRAHTPNAHRDPAPPSDYSRLLGESAEMPRKSQTGRFRLHPPCPGGFCRTISERCRRLVSTAVVQLVLPA